jgi:hypothetical protein
VDKIFEGNMFKVAPKLMNAKMDEKKNGFISFFHQLFTDVTESIML